MYKRILGFVLAVCSAASVQAAGFQISTSHLFLEFNDGTAAVFDELFDVDTLTVAGAAGDYSFAGTLRISPVTPTATLAGNGGSPAPFIYAAPIFLDLTDVSITCNLAPGQPCGYFDIDFFIAMDFEPTANPLRIDSMLDGSAPADFAGQFTSAIDLFDDSFVRVDDTFWAGNVTAPGGVITQQLFSLSLNTTGATNIVFTGDFFSQTGLSGGQSLTLPSSFSAVLGPSAIPEPGTVWLLLSGAAALGWTRRRRA